MNALSKAQKARTRITEIDTELLGIGICLSVYGKKEHGFAGNRLEPYEPAGWDIHSIEINDVDISDGGAIDEAVQNYLSENC